MTQSFDPGALLGASYQLPEGTRVRLRLTGPSDRVPVERLLAGAGEADARLQSARLIRSDPRRRLVMCAAALGGGGADIVGVGAIELDGIADPVPDVLIVAEHAPEGVRELLAGALLGRALLLARIRAA